MSQPHDSNPFASPQSGRNDYTAEAETLPEQEILQAVESELANTKFGLWAVALTTLGFAGITLWQIILVIIRVGTMPSSLGGLIAVVIYGAAGILALRIAGKIKEFGWNPKPSTMEDVFSAHAAYWKFLGVVAVVALAIFLPLAFLALLMIR